MYIIARCREMLQCWCRGKLTSNWPLSTAGLLAIFTAFLAQRQTIDAVEISPKETEIGSNYRGCKWSGQFPNLRLQGVPLINVNGLTEIEQCIEQCGRLTPACVVVNWLSDEHICQGFSLFERTNPLNGDPFKSEAHTVFVDEIKCTPSLNETSQASPVDKQSKIESIPTSASSSLEQSQQQFQEQQQANTSSIQASDMRPNQPPVQKELLPIIPISEQRSQENGLKPDAQPKPSPLTSGSGSLVSSATVQDSQTRLAANVDDFDDDFPPGKPFLPQKKIVGGTEATYTWPWQVALLNAHGTVSCGGTLIRPDVVVTAAHCIERGTRRFVVGVGLHNLRRATADAEFLRVIAAVRHENYNDRTVANDIALLRLERPVKIAFTKQTIPLPQSFQDVPPGTNCVITGWGTLGENRGRTVPILQQATVPIIDPRICGSRRYYRRGIQSSTMLCAGYESGGVDSCMGDSGGPLVCVTNNQWTLQGIVSWGRGCGRPFKPTVYTKVSSFIHWIRDNLPRLYSVGA